MLIMKWNLLGKDSALRLKDSGARDYTDVLKTRKKYTLIKTTLYYS